MAAPDPWARVLIELSKRQGLRIVHDNNVMLQMHSERVLERDLLIGAALAISDFDRRPLQAVMEFLGEGEELRTAFHDTPAHLDAHGIHEQRQRRQDLGHSTAVLRRADVDDVEILQLRSLGENPANRLVTDKGPVFLDRVQPEGGRFNSFLHFAPRANPMTIKRRSSRCVPWNARERHRARTCGMSRLATATHAASTPFGTAQCIISSVCCPTCERRTLQQESLEFFDARRLHRAPTTQPSAIDRLSVRRTELMAGRDRASKDLSIEAATIIPPLASKRNPA